MYIGLLHCLNVCECFLVSVCCFMFMFLWILVVWYK